MALIELSSAAVNPRAQPLPARPGGRRHPTRDAVATLLPQAWRWAVSSFRLLGVVPTSVCWAVAWTRDPVTVSGHHVGGITLHRGFALNPSASPAVRPRETDHRAGVAQIGGGWCLRRQRHRGLPPPPDSLGVIFRMGHCMRFVKTRTKYRVALHTTSARQRCVRAPTLRRDRGLCERLSRGPRAPGDSRLALLTIRREKRHLPVKLLLSQPPGPDPPTCSDRMMTGK